MAKHCITMLTGMSQGPEGFGGCDDEFTLSVTVGGVDAENERFSVQMYVTKPIGV